MGTLNIDSRAELYFEVHGTGEPVLFLNGLMGGPALWSSYARELSNTYQCVFHCFRGQAPTKAFAAFGFDELISDVKALIDHLGLSRVNLIGDAFGASVALRFAAAYPHAVERLVLSGASSPAPDLKLGLKIKAWYEVLKNAGVGTLFDAILPDLNSDTYLVEKQERLASIKEKWIVGKSREELLMLFEALFDRKRPLDFSEITQPSLIVQQRKDDIVRPFHGQKLKELLPHALYRELDCGHAVFEEKAEEYLALVRQFLKGVLVPVVVDDIDQEENEQA